MRWPLLVWHRKKLWQMAGFRRPLFSLETACWMFDLSWQAYYDPPGQTTPSSESPHTHATVPGLHPTHRVCGSTQHYNNTGYGPVGQFAHGFTIDAFVGHLPSDTHGYVLRRGPRVVVAFRGTSSTK